MSDDRNVENDAPAGFADVAVKDNAAPIATAEPTNPEPTNPEPTNPEPTNPEPTPAPQSPSEAPAAKGDDAAKKPRKPRAKKGNVAKTEAATAIDLDTSITVAEGTRHIGLRHRMKRTADNEARPTQLAIFKSDGTINRLDLATEQHEMWWVFGLYPTKFRPVEPTEDLAASLASFAVVCEANKVLPDISDPGYRELFLGLCNRRKLKKDETIEAFNAALRVTVDGEEGVIIDAPIAFDGLRRGDVHISSLGGSGDTLAFALSRRSERLRADSPDGPPTTIVRIPPRFLKERREAKQRDKDGDSLTLVELWHTNPGAFYECDVRDRARITVSESVRARIESMRARMECGQRLLQRSTGRIFRSNEYPEGNLEARLKNILASDPIFTNLDAEEKARIKEIEKAVKDNDVCQMLMELDGIGPLTAADLYAAIGDVRRFEVKPDAEQLSQLRSRARAALEEGHWRDDALEVLIRAKTVVDSADPKVRTKAQRMREKFVQADALSAWRYTFERRSREQENAELIAAGKEPKPSLPEKKPIVHPPMLHLPSLLKAAATIKAQQGQTNQVAALHEAVRLIRTPGSIAADALVGRVRQLAAEGGLLDVLLEIRTREYFERVIFLHGLEGHKRRIGKVAEADKIAESLKGFEALSRLKWKASERSKAKLRHFCGVFVRQGGKYADVPPEQAFPRKRRGTVCNWDPLARQRLFLFSQDQCNRQARAPWGLFLRLCKAIFTDKHPVEVEIDKGADKKKVKRYTKAHINKMAGWKTAFTFINLLYDAWMALEEDYRRRQAVTKK